MTEREKQLDKMNDKLAERNGELILENMELKAQAKNFKFDRDNLKKRLSEAPRHHYFNGQISESVRLTAEKYRNVETLFALVELTDSELKEIS